MYVRGHRPAKSGWLLFRSGLWYIEIEADDRCMCEGFKTNSSLIIAGNEGHLPTLLEECKGGGGQGGGG